jgi:hypothetical protein
VRPVRTFSVKDYQKFQHYKDRSPPWIKLYNSTLDDYDFGALPDATKYHLVAIWLLASRSANKIPYDAVWVAARINAREPVNLDLLVKAGFLLLEQEVQSAEHDASALQAECLSRERGRGREDDIVVEGRASGSETAAEDRPPAKPIVSPERRAAIALGLAFVQAAGFEDYAAAPMNWYGVADRAAVWIATGWTEAMIVAETKIVANRAGTPMPLAYFEKVFATAAARAAQPLPIATVKSAETFDVARPNSTARANRSVGDALTAITRRLEQDDGETGHHGGDRLVQMLAER